jgi:acid-sensing ion channel, other
MNQVKKSFQKTLTESRDKIILESICTIGDSLSNNEAQNFEGKWTYVRQFLLNASQPCAHMMKICRFGTKKIDCDKNFTSVLTDEGLCCSFNAGHPNILLNDFQQSDHVEEEIDNIDYMTWSPETGYDSKDKRSSYPNPVPGKVT